MQKIKLNDERKMHLSAWGIGLIAFLLFLMGCAAGRSSSAQEPKVPETISNKYQNESMMVRLSEIEIDPVYLEEYRSILKEEAAASVKLEPGVIAIFPMYQKENETQVRIVEIYKDSAAYKSHLSTPHFQHYKTSTLKMVKSLKLVDMTDFDTAAMRDMFLKMK